MVSRRYIFMGIIGTFLLMLVGGYAAYYEWAHYKPTIVAFNYEQDLNQVLGLFKQNWYWMFTGNSSYDQKHMISVLKYMAPERKPNYIGILKVDVLKQRNKVLGLVAYFIDPVSGFGRLLFLLVDKVARGQKYGKMLLHHGMQQLINSGVKKVRLLTRTNNIPAQKLYRGYGFYPIDHPGNSSEIIYFDYDPPMASSDPVPVSA